MSKISLAFRQKLFIGLCLNCLPRVHKDIVRKLFLRKKLLFITLGCRAKIFCPKHSGGLEKSRFSVSNWKSDEKHDFWKKVSPTSDMQRNLVCFLSKLWRVYTARENCILRVHLKIFKTKNCFWKNQYFFSYFWDIDRFFPGLPAKVFCQVCKTATYLPRGTV